MSKHSPDHSVVYEGVYCYDCKETIEDDPRDSANTAGCRPDPVGDVASASISALEEIRKLFHEPHHLGFPVSGFTGTYDPTTVMVKRDWYDRLAALVKGVTT